ncbi:MAG TPA: hypothetical protein VM532_17610, partial [Burkholderiales bacterium]|nr:hypothetical protein [Burkholderiales bacterium]
QRWREWLSRVAVITRVSRLLGWRNAAYLRRMFKLFDDGDIREALRHAIPLADDSPSRGQAFNTPRPREDLSLSSGLSPGVDMGLGEELSDYLRKLYRTIFQRLDRERRIDEAVFVLAELLQVRREAIDYLERHNRFAQAAELALSWDFSPDAIVRLLCLADKWDRAMEVARRDNAFSAAVLLLEKQRPLLAQRLRLKWATALVTQGEWLKAVEVIWPVEKARDVAAKWLKVAETGDGGLAARALVQRAILLPDTIERYADRLIALRDGPEAYARAEFAAALLAVKGKSAAMSKLARAILPQLLADRMQNANQLTRNELDLLIKLANDPLLKADLPPLQLPTLPEPIPLQDAPTPRKWSAPDSGLQPIVDIAYLRPNCFLIAQGDVGVAMIDSRGDTLQRYAIAADRLVIGDSGHVALALAKRDTVWRVARIDLVTHHVRDLGVLPLTHFATGFDGIAWTVVSNDRLLVLDTAHSLRDVLWHVSDLPGPVAALSRTPHSEHLVVTTPTGTELWGYQLPGRRLVGRDSMPEWVSPQRFARLTPTGDAIYLMLDSETSGGVSLTYNYGPHSFSTPLPGISEALDGIAFFLTNDWLVAGPSQTGRIDWFLIRLKTGKLCARISWPNHNNPRVTASSKNLYFFDSSGRILEISENSNEPLAIVLR